MEGGDWTFERFRLAPARGLLLRDGAPVALARKPFAVLVHLVRHRDRVVPREELLEVVWPDVAVSRAALASVVRDLRRALGDTGREPRFVATLRGRGLRFVHPVRGTGARAEPEAPEASAADWHAVAGDLERAVRALEAVERSRGRALGHDRTGSAEQVALRLALGRARWSSGATDEARRVFGAAVELARRTGDAEMLARAALGFAGRTDATPGVNDEAVARLEEALQALPATDAALRVELLARLGTELARRPDGARSLRLTAEAVAMGERVGEPGALAYALTARHYALQRPEVEPQARRALAERAAALVGEAPVCDVLALALQERLLDLLEAGEGRAFEEGLLHYAQCVDALGQPFFDWMRSLYAGTRALLAGRVKEAERRAQATLRIGLRIRSPNAAAAFAAQRFGVARARGRLADLAPQLGRLAGEAPGLPVLAAGFAAATAAAGRAEETRAALARVMARDLEDFPRDGNWIASLALLAEAAAKAEDADRARRIEPLLRPYAGRMVVAGHGALVHGAVDHHLALLAATTGDRGAALAHLDRAEALHEQAGARSWARETRAVREAILGPRP